MRRLVGLRFLPPVLGLAACDVQVRDTTPAEYTANHDIGMYQVSAAVTRGALVAPGSVFMFALGQRQRITLASNAEGSEWHGIYPVRCQSSFPLQFQAEWKGLLDVKQKLVPAQPRQISLREPPLTPSARFDASGKQAKGGWQGGVQYRFVTQPGVRINAAHIEPDSAATADLAAARPLSVVSSFPVVAGCADLVEVRLASTAAHAHGTLVIDTDHPAVAHWRTRVEFSP
ncbi:MAG TPA: hypothetical protein VK803_02260 [Steroidobacteraceae bacterium]|jgi:hypothetical protein|nr:hypothetical protein [Steroidobacteraceae bacterium]